MDVYRNQMMEAIAKFKNPDYGQQIQRQIEMERERQKNLTSRAAQLEKEVCILFGFLS